MFGDALNKGMTAIACKVIHWKTFFKRKILETLVILTAWLRCRNQVNIKTASVRYNMGLAH
jgi:hypothetical protein